mmetsp:Transcript_49834/g.119998  ORF Transcript_49834/g.119998 Transcript_49834/m.119998 type:complete len:241 (+) Transcript_49834:134-856(+)
MCGPSRSSSLTQRQCRRRHLLLPDRPPQRPRQAQARRPSPLVDLGRRTPLLETGGGVRRSWATILLPRPSGPPRAWRRSAHRRRRPSRVGCRTSTPGALRVAWVRCGATTTPAQCATTTHCVATATRWGRMAWTICGSARCGPTTTTTTTRIRRSLRRRLAPAPAAALRLHPSLRWAISWVSARRRSLLLLLRLLQGRRLPRRLLTPHRCRHLQNRHRQSRHRQRLQRHRQRSHPQSRHR